jgi:ribosomal protein S18 acetylase RimI-like enzyme
MRVTVTTWHLEMRSPSELRPKGSIGSGEAVVEVTFPWPELNRFFYTAVGGEWYWTDRLVWDRARWLAYLDRPELRTLVLTTGGLPAGYCELERQADGEVELVYFGLLPQFAGRGLGGPFLTEVVRRAWADGAGRVWVHTCSLDHPAALANYQARGFRVFRIEEEAEEKPLAPPGPWPGSG